MGVLLLVTCASAQSPADQQVERAIAAYRDRQAAQLAVRDYRGTPRTASSPRWALFPPTADSGAPGRIGRHEDDAPLTLGMFADEPPTTTSPATPPATAPARNRWTAPEGYWRKDIWHQMGHEALALGKHDFWHGYKTSFWDLENALVLTATMGASIAIRETGVDDTIRNRTRGSRALGDFDEPIQILGHPGTHFAAAGALWLGSALLKDVREHEVAQSLVEALAVNGVTTVLLKVATNTRTPDGEHFGWPSGHTSSAFTAAAVLNEYYGPWVGVPSLALAGLVGYQRLDSEVHDFSDVVFGAMLGYVIGSSIAKDEKAAFPEVFGMKVIPYADPETGAAGLALLKRW
jgi:membrane-associated phospholipid phosphatase